MRHEVATRRRWLLIQAQKLLDDHIGHFLVSKFMGEELHDLNLRRMEKLAEDLLCEVAEREGCFLGFFDIKVKASSAPHNPKLLQLTATLPKGRR